MKDFISRLTSRKFLLAVMGVVVVFFVPMSDVQITALTALIIAFTAAEGGADIVSRIQNQTVTHETRTAPRLEEIEE